MQSLREGLKIPTIIIPQNTLTCYILLTLMLMMLIISCWSQWDYNTPFMIGIRVHILRRWGICVIKFLQFFSASLDIIIIIITAEEGHQKLDFFQIGDPNLIWECLLRENFFYILVFTEIHLLAIFSAEFGTCLLWAWDFPVELFPETQNSDEHTQCIKHCLINSL